jgi:hypothetical protein
LGLSSDVDFGPISAACAQDRAAQIVLGGRHVEVVAHAHAHRAQDRVALVLGTDHDQARARRRQLVEHVEHALGVVPQIRDDDLRALRAHRRQQLARVDRHVSELDRAFRLEAKRMAAQVAIGGGVEDARRIRHVGSQWRWQLGLFDEHDSLGAEAEVAAARSRFGITGVRVGAIFLIEGADVRIRRVRAQRATLDDLLPLGPTGALHALPGAGVTISRISKQTPPLISIGSPLAQCAASWHSTTGSLTTHESAFQDEPYR